MKAKWFILTAIVIALFVFWSRSPKQPDSIAIVSSNKPEKRLNVVLISIDTVRADLLSVYEAGGAPTPEMERIASQGILFENAIAQVPFTLPSHSSLFTGTYPMWHNVQENGRIKLSDQFTTLAEVFQQNGYQTSAFVGAIVLQSATGLAQGFDYYDDAFVNQNPAASLERSADAVNSSFRKWYKTRDLNRPYFAFIHFYDAHAPYDPPFAFRPKDTSPLALYKGELSYVDQTIGQVFSTVTSKSKEDTVVLIVGDHGEMLGDHGESGHGYYIYQPALRVPLIVFHPQIKQKKRIEQTVQVMDVMPSLIESLHLPVDSKKMHGRSFISLINSGSQQGRLAYSESLTPTEHFGAAPLRSVQDGRYKFIQTARSELYDLRADPHETKNLLDQAPDVARKMEQHLTGILRCCSRPAEPAMEQISGEVQEKLKALGYVSGGSSQRIRTDRDAKDLLEFWKKLIALSSAISLQRNSDARRLISEFRQSGIVPDSVQLMDVQLLMQENRLGEAEAILKGVIRNDQRNLQALALSGEVYEKRNEPEQAKVFYRRVAELERSPSAIQRFTEQMLRLKRPGEIRSLIQSLQQSGKLTPAMEEAARIAYGKLEQSENRR